MIGVVGLFAMRMKAGLRAAGSITVVESITMVDGVSAFSSSVIP